MSATVDFLTVTHSIASLSISGVTVKDAHEITDSMSMQTAILTPRALNFVTNFRVEPVEVSKQNLNVYYTLNYVYYHSKAAGGLGGLFATYSAVITNLALIVKAFCNDATLSGAMDNGAPVIGQIAATPDNAGNLYHTCEISIDVMQFLEV